MWIWMCVRFPEPVEAEWSRFDSIHHLEWVPPGLMNLDTRNSLWFMNFRLYFDSPAADCEGSDIVCNPDGSTGAVVTRAQSCVGRRLRHDSRRIESRNASSEDRSCSLKHDPISNDVSRLVPEVEKNQVGNPQSYRMRWPHYCNCKMQYSKVLHNEYNDWVWGYTPAQNQNLCWV